MNISTIQIPDIFQILLSIVSSVMLVYLIEFLKQPSIKIEKADDLLIPGRKLLKIKVSVYTKGWYRKIFPWQNSATDAKLVAQLISRDTGTEIVLQEYAIKWDTNPEPWDYEKNIPRPEMLPLVSRPQNLLPGDECYAAVAIKHEKEQHYYIYDGNYYIESEKAQNIQSRREVILRLRFKSNSISPEPTDFIILNENNDLASFKLKPNINS